MPVDPQSSNALDMRYSCAIPTLAVAGDRWRRNHGFCDVCSSVVNHVTLTLLMRLRALDNRPGVQQSPAFSIFFRALRDR